MVQVREIDSVLKMRSGEVVILGGLMEDRSRMSQAGIPGIDDVPLFGAMTRGFDEERQVTELVIFLSARVLY